MSGLFVAQPPGITIATTVTNRSPTKNPLVSVAQKSHTKPTTQTILSMRRSKRNPPTRAPTIPSAMSSQKPWPCRLTILLPTKPAISQGRSRQLMIPLFAFSSRNCLVNSSKLRRATNGRGCLTQTANKKSHSIRHTNEYNYQGQSATHPCTGAFSLFCYGLLVGRLNNGSRRPELSRSKTWRPAAASEQRILIVPLGSGFAERH
jgi:hypothetical protein